MHMEPEFNCQGKLIVGTDLNKTAARDHVHDIESQIKVVKEQMWEVHGVLWYESITSHMII